MGEKRTCLAWVFLGCANLSGALTALAWVFKVISCANCWRSVCSSVPACLGGGGALAKAAPRQSGRSVCGWVALRVLSFWLFTDTSSAIGRHLRARAARATATAPLPGAFLVSGARGFVPLALSQMAALRSDSDRSCSLRLVYLRGQRDWSFDSVDGCTRTTNATPIGSSTNALKSRVVRDGGYDKVARNLATPPWVSRFAPTFCSAEFPHYSPTTWHF